MLKSELEEKVEKIIGSRARIQQYDLFTLIVVEGCSVNDVAKTLQVFNPNISQDIANTFSMDEILLVPVNSNLHIVIPNEMINVEIEETPTNLEN